MGSGGSLSLCATRPSKRIDRLHTWQVRLIWSLDIGYFKKSLVAQSAVDFLKALGFGNSLSSNKHFCWRGVSSIGLLGSVSFTHCCASTSDLSTWWSSTALIARPGFEVGFPLRCFQRLSLPYIATQLCRWHDNWSTRGTSTPVLSY